MISGPIHIDLDGFKVQLNITCTELGEVLQVENPFLSLPEEAQRLSLGMDFEEKIIRIKAYERWIRYKLPFAIARNLRDKDIGDLLDKIYEIRPQKKLDITSIKSLRFQDKWVKQLYQTILAYYESWPTTGNTPQAYWTKKERRDYD